ncbi:MAG: hypothetical protein ACTSU9_00560 [Promethearchaeota archaeon]
MYDPNYNPISPLEFLKHNQLQEKNNLTWFCYETSLSIFDTLEELHGWKDFKSRMNRKSFKKVAMELGNVLRNKLTNQLERKGKDNPIKVGIDAGAILTHFPRLKGIARRELFLQVNEVLSYQLESCKDCPNHCLSNPDATCALFDLEDSNSTLVNAFLDSVRRDEENQ